MNRDLSIRKEANNRAFYDTIRERESKGELVDLLLKVGTPKAEKRISDGERPAIEKVLSPYMVVPGIEFFDFIPFARIETTPYLARQLADEMFREGYVFSSGRVPLVRDVDVSHEVFLPDLLEADLSGDQKRMVEAARRLYSHAPRILDAKDVPIEGPHWNLKNIGHYQALSEWNELGNDVSVAVVDTGCDFHHPEIRDRFNPNKWGYNFIHNNDYPMDDHMHGTHVAGSVAGMYVGVAPDARLYAVKVLSSSGSGSEAGVIRGIEWCIRNAVDVINMSLGASAASAAFKQVCQEAKDRGIYVVCAAGNSYYGYGYPAAFPSTIAIAAVDKEKKHAQFSNVNDKLDFSAPGVDVFSCVPGGGYRTASGTSMASPHGAGEVACGLGVVEFGKNGHMVDEHLSIIKETCDPCVGTGSPFIDRTLYGAGHGNVANLMRTLFERY